MQSKLFNKKILVLHSQLFLSHLIASTGGSFLDKFNNDHSRKIHLKKKMIKGREDKQANGHRNL